MQPIVYPSEVAALLGKNRFKSSYEAMVDLISRMPKFKSTIAEFKRSTGALTEKELVKAAPPSIKESIEQAVQSTVRSTSQKDIQATIDTFQTSSTTTLLNDALNGKSEYSEFRESAKKIRLGLSTVEKEINQLRTTPVVTSLTREIQKNRGTQMEASTGDDITHRGTPVRYECGEYILAGYIDGIQEGKVVEIKSRKHFWRVPPTYDIIQLRCYMKMRGGVDGILLESFPGGEKRQTDVKWNPEEWQGIHDGLADVMNTISRMEQKDVFDLLRETLLIKTERPQ